MTQQISDRRQAIRYLLQDLSDRASQGYFIRVILAPSKKAIARFGAKRRFSIKEAEERSPDFLGVSKCNTILASNLYKNGDRIMAKPSLSSFPYRLGLMLGLMLCSGPVAAQQVEPPPDNSPTAPLLQESGSLSPGDETLDDGSLYDTYSFEGRAGQSVTISVESEEFDTYLILLDAEGKQIADNDDSAGNSDSKIVATLTKDGIYKVIVNGYDANSQGGYALSISPASEADIRRALADRLYEEGMQIYRQGTAESLQGAIEKWEEAILIYRELGYRTGEARILNNIGFIYSSLGEKQKALDYYSRALSIYQETGDRAGEATTLNNISLIYSSLGEKQKGLDYLDRALPLHQETGNRTGEATTLNNIGSVYDDLGEKQKALNYYEQALPLHQETGNRAGEAATFNNIGSVYDDLGEKQKALDYYERALPIVQETGNRAGEAATLNNIGLVYNSLGEKEKALDYLERALPLRQETGDRAGEATTLNNIGAVYDDLEEKEKALDYYERALPLRQEIGDRGGEALTLVNIGIVYFSLGEKEKALDYLERALPILQAVGDRAGEAATLFNFARLERSSNNLDKSHAHIEAAIEIIEELRTKIVNQELRTSYFATVQDYYEFYIDLLMELHRENPDRGYEGLALEASERARARSLLELLAEASADIRAGVDPQLRDKERSLQQRINAAATRQSELLSGEHSPEQAEAIKKELDELLGELEQVRAEIRQKSPGYADLTQPQPLELKEIQALLDEETLLLEYSLGKERGYLWAVTPTSITAYELPGREEIEKIARNFRSHLTAPSLRIRRQRVARATAALSDAILEPVSELLETQKYKRLLIVGDGVLNYIPFTALSLPEAPSPQPLIADYEIINLPSASTLATLRRDLLAREPAPKTVAILADPVFDLNDERIASNASNANNATATEPNNPGIILETIKKAARAAGVEWTRLPGTRLETQRIMALVAPGQGREILDFDASQEIAKSPELSQYRILHFATHGFANSENPELSGIVMSLVDERGRQQDGYLRLHDIYNLELNADLTILSACQTGLGQQIRGEGLIGLTRGFMYAGTPRVVASLWSVDDRATAELMGIFYQKMLQENMAPAAALRAAQIEISQQKEWQMPYYWAAFGLQGEWR